MSARRLSFAILGAAIATPSFAQVPDLLNALDAGGRAMGVGGSLYPTSSDTLSSYYNPAGLGYLNQPTVGLTVRNLPRATTTASGDLNTPTLSSRGVSGNRELTHFGLAIPFAKGALGFAYTVGGFLDEVRNGNVTLGGQNVSNYAERIRAKSEYFSIGYGVSSKDSTFSWGLGLQFVQQRLSDELQGSVNGAALSGTDPATTNGIAGLIGFQFNPKGSNMSWGFSYRTAVNLSDNNSTSLLMDKIPARLQGGIAFRQDGVRRSKDFLVYGAQITHFFDANNNGQNFQRKSQTTAGLGFEYNYEMSGARIPLRLGYNFVPSGGPDFGDRNALTFGIGYRPSKADYMVDLNIASPQHGGFDLGLSLSYKLGSK